MPQETTPIAGRIDTKDFDFLVGASFGGATTLSEKLRFALSFFRKFNEGMEGFDEALEVLDSLAGKGRRSIVSAEMQEGTRSELVHACMDHVPPLLALLAAQAGVEQSEKPAEALRELEERLLRQMLPFVESFLRLAVTNRSPCYNPSILKSRLEGVHDAASRIVRN